MVILENIDIDIDFLENIDIDRIFYQIEFGISDRATRDPPDEYPELDISQDQSKR